MNKKKENNMKQVKMIFNVDDKGNIVNLEKENLFKISNDVIEKTHFLVTFTENLNRWSGTMLMGMADFQDKFHSKES